ncbi:MAG: hypothetical protein IMZ50_01560, partial [Candidatus Atribacteria bacterium]|nr:hypothetical protein [Candidatus Atribacteria bacterium]
MTRDELSVRERWMLAVHHQEADRVPICPKMSSEFIAQQIGKTYWDIGWKDYYEMAVAYGYDCSVFWCLQGNPAGNEGMLLRRHSDRV